MLERVYPPAVVSLMGEALNKRMNTTGLSLEQMGNLMQLRNMTIDEVFGMVE